MSRQVRRLALYGYLGSGNIGNDASFETVLTWLQSRHPDIELRCITIAPEVIQKRYRVASTALAWRPRELSNNRIVRTVQKIFGRLRDVPRSFVLAGSVDAIIVPGMGVLEDTLGVRPFGMPLWLFVTAAVCRVRSRPFVLLDVGAEYATNPLTRRLNVATVRLATHVSYRDQESAAAMARAGLREPQTVAPDLAFAHPWRASTRPEPGRLVVGVMAYYGPADDPIQGARVRRRYVDTMASALTELAQQGRRIVLVGGDRVDMDVARELKAAVVSACPELSGGAIEVREITTFGTLTEEMMKAEVVVASRFHNLICALRAGRPAVSIGYADKNRHLMQALGVGEFCQDILGLDADQLIAQVRAAHQSADALAAQIRRATSAYAAQVETLLDQMAMQSLGLTSASDPQSRRSQDEVDAWRGT